MFLYKNNTEDEKCSVKAQKYLSIESYFTCVCCESAYKGVNVRQLQVNKSCLSNYRWLWPSENSKDNGSSLIS